jgi:putative flippase GtrA
MLNDIVEPQQGTRRVVRPLQRGQQERPTRRVARWQGQPQLHGNELIDSETKETALFGNPGVRRKSVQELVLFGLVGIANTAFGYGLYAFCLYLGWPYQAATVLSMLGSIGVGFLGQGRLVFRNVESRRIGRYVVMWVGLLLLFNLVVNVTTYAGYSAYLGGLVALPIIIPLSFLVQKLYVFRR